MFEKEFGQHHAWGWIALATLAASLMTFLQTSDAFAQRVEIFDVRRTLAMAPKDPVYKDYYLTAGRESGLREGLIISVVRSTPVFDHARNIARGELDLPMGQLRVIYVGEKMSVARAYKETSRVDHPVAEVEGFMIGDRLDLSDAFMEKGAGAATGSDTHGASESAKGTSGEGVQAAAPSVAPPVPAKAQEIQPDPQATTAPPAPNVKQEAAPEKRDVASDQPKKATPAPEVKAKPSQPAPSPQKAAGDQKAPQIVGEIPGVDPKALVR